jgi:hypothetical protein
MADVRSFQLSLSQFGQATQRQLSAVLRRAALEVFRDIVKGSPVDTGRFKSSWFIGIGAPDRSVAPERPQNRQARGVGGVAVDESLARLDSLTPTSVDGTQPIYISNNLPYAERLADGHSTQAPSGWIEAAVQRVQRKMSGEE